MKLSYYTYLLRNHKTGERYLGDLRPFLSAFVALEDVNFKNQFSHAGEHVYLARVHADLHVFIATRSNEIIKKIKSSDLSISEISDLLQRDEHLGFASYVYFSNKFVGYASTIMAPKAMAFANFLNSVLDAVQIHEYRFDLQAVLQDTSVEDALKMPFIGRSSIQVSKESRLFDDLRVQFGGSVEDFESVDSFEIVIKPKPRQNIEKAVKRAIKNVKHVGLEKFVCNAKEDLHDQLTEHYLVGNGMLSDLNSKGTEMEIYDAIKARVSNPVLAEKLREFEQNEGIAKKLPGIFSDLSVSSAWTDRLSRL